MSAGLYFALSNGESNAEDVTSYLSYFKQRANSKSGRNPWLFIFYKNDSLILCEKC